jgi:hypothetical protein
LATQKLFFIYVSKHDEWQEREKTDWDYVYSMTRFFHWWIKRIFNIDFNLQADILPVVPGKLFDRMSVAYLMRDHKERGNKIYHFYLAYFKPFWTDCGTEGYSADNFGMVEWKRPDKTCADSMRSKYFADVNCPKVSHLITHEVLRNKGNKRKEYFDAVHDLWNRHLHNELPYLYYNERFTEVSKSSSYRYVTLDIKQLKSIL